MTDDQWSGWQKWLDGHLDIRTHAIIETVMEAVQDLEAKRERQVHELELKIAELTGALGVLRRGGGMHVCGTYSEGTRYEQHDVAILNGSSFVATRDNPGQCPGESWQLLASRGLRGERGAAGPRGAQGERGEPGENAAAGAFLALHIDPQDYSILLSTADGKIHTLNLRPLFQKFVDDMRAGGIKSRDMQKGR